LAAPAEIDKINEILGTRTLAVQLCFASLGRFCAPAEAITRPRPQALALPKSLRARVLWVCNQSRIYADRQRRPLGRLSDLDLAETFVTLTVAPGLAAQKHAIERQLRVMLFGTRRP
jgi:hypothetical protein